MKILVTGSSGHLGEALVRVLRADGHAVLGLDLLEGEFTDRVGSIADPAFVRSCMGGIEAVLHTAALHKPHVATHTKEQFVRANVTGTLHVLEEAVAAGVERFVFTSTTSVFGAAGRAGEEGGTVWVDEELEPRPKNIYGTTKVAAEWLCRLFHLSSALPVVVLTTSRFFPEEDDDEAIRKAYEDENVKLNELLYRRVDLEDVVRAHQLALERAPELGFARFLISATPPFTRSDRQGLASDAPAVVRRLLPGCEKEYELRGWRLFPTLDRVYDNAKARRELGWEPTLDFATALQRLKAGEPVMSALAREVGSKGYHSERFANGPYPVGEGAS